MDFKLRSEVVEFKDSDGTLIGKVTVRQAGIGNEQVLYEMQHRAALENELEFKKIFEQGGESLTLIQQQRQTYRYEIYPRLVACSEGDIPDEETAFYMPAEYSFAWYTAAEKCNPDWFEMFRKIGELAAKSAMTKEEALEDKKKEEPSPPESTNA